MDTDISRDMAGARQKAAVVQSGGSDPGRDVRSFAQEPDLIACSQRQAPPIHRQAHGLIESADQGGQPALRLPHD
jgi:hypothetical protein